MHAFFIILACTCILVLVISLIDCKINSKSPRNPELAYPLKESINAGALSVHSKEGKFRVATAVLVIKLDNSTIEKLARRNNAISKCSWAADVDHLVFHEVSKVDTNALAAKSNLSLTPIDVSKTFERGRALSKIRPLKDGLCNSTTLVDFPTGYRTMCWFWFSEFLHYVEAYDAILRIDDDCYLESAPMWPTSPSPVSAVIEYWGMDSPNYTSGMFSFFSELKKTLSQAHYIKKTAPFPKTWVSPYSNVMLYNANFLRNHVAFSVVADMVQSSRCIWIGRWGDLPLWGATRNVLNFEISNLQHFSYIHGSHDNRLVTSPTHGSKLKSLWHMHIT